MRVYLTILTVNIFCKRGLMSNVTSYSQFHTQHMPLLVSVNNPVYFLLFFAKVYHSIYISSGLRDKDLKIH